MIKKFKPETKFIISGDYNQLPTICDRISEHYNYSRNPALFELCNFNKIELTKCRRANDKLFNLIKSDNIPNLTPSNFNTTSKVTDYNTHLCFTNKKRININHALMEAKKIQYENAKKSEYTGKSIILDQPQITLHIDNLVIYKEDKERFKIIDIEDDYITIQNKSKTVKFNAVQSFNKYFEIIPSLLTFKKLFYLIFLMFPTSDECTAL
jgi:hypothetical protein